MLSANEILRDRYEIIRLLGQGGMGAVYEAHDSVFDTSVALKEIVVDLSNAQNTNAQEMLHVAFEREAKLLAKINHETFPHVKDYFSFENRQFLVMELVDGEDLAKLLKQRQSPFPVSDVMNWAGQLLDGLDYLHTQNPPIIHRDLKPQNLKLNSRGKIKLLDFGIAKGTDTTNATTITDQTFVAATLNYSPIEQMLRVIDPTFLAVITHKYQKQIEPLLEQTADVRSDIYALGATVYNLLTASPPVEAVKRGIDIWDGNPDPLKYPGSLNSAIPEGLSIWILKAMQVRREHRFNSAKEMLVELNKIDLGTTRQSAQKTEVMQIETSDLPLPATDSPVPTGDQSNSVETIAAPRPVAATGQPPAAGVVTAGSHVATSSQVEGKKPSYKLLWLIPVFGVLMMLFAIGAVGMWWVLANRAGTASEENTNAANANTAVTTDLANGNTDDSSEPETTTETSDISNSNMDIETPGTPPPPAPATPAPRTVKTPAPRRVTPAPVRPKTPPPTPRVVSKPPKTPKKKNMDCIFTDDC